MKRQTLRPRNGGRWTEAEYWSRVRSALRKAFSHWTPANQCLLDARRPYRGDNKRQKWEYLCAMCGDWFKGDSVRKDHVEPVGTLKRPEDMAAFLARLTPEDSTAFQCVCIDCHRAKTRDDNNATRGKTA